METDSSANLTTVAKSRKTWGQFWRFFLIGLMNVFIDLAVLNLLILITGVGRTGVWFTVFKAISFTVAVINSYYFNRRWVFRDRKLKKWAWSFRSF